MFLINRLFFFILITFYLIFVVYPVYAENKNISVVVIINPKSTIHNTSASEIVSRLSINENINVSIKSSDEVSSLRESKIDYAISIGSASATEILKLNPVFPVLFTFSSDLVINNILNDGNKNYYAISLAQPALRQLRLSKLLLKKSGKIGLTLGPNTEQIITQFNLESKKLNIDLVVKKSTDYSEPIDAIRESLEESDMYIATYDFEILNRHTAKWLLYMAYKINKPIIGYSSAFTKSGAVASLYSTPKQFGTQSADWVLNMLNKETLIKKQSPKYFTITINSRVQRILKLPYISSLTIKSRILAMEGDDLND